MSGIRAVGIGRDRDRIGQREKRLHLSYMERAGGRASLFAFSKVVWTADKIFGDECRGGVDRSDVFFIIGMASKGA